jgi:hypothetical protein
MGSILVFRGSCWFEFLFRDGAQRGVALRRVAIRGKEPAVIGKADFSPHSQ